MDFRKHLCGFTYIDILIQPYIQINITQTQQSHTRAHTHTHTHTHTHRHTHLLKNNHHSLKRCISSANANPHI